MQKKYSIVIVFLFIFFSVIVYYQIPNQDAHFDIDSYGYQDLAVLFFNTGSMVDINNPLRAPVQPIGYPLFMGIVYALCGVHVPIIIALQVLLMAISILCIMHIASLLFNAQIAYLTGLFSIVNIGFLVYPQFILAETMLFFLLTIFFMLFAYFFLHNAERYLISAGAVLGLSILVKPTALLLPVILVPVIMYNRRVHRLRSILLFMICFLTPIMFYMLRNYLLYGYFSFAPMMALNMYQCFLAKVMHMITEDSIEHIVNTQLRFTASNSFDPSGWEKARVLFFTYLHEYPFSFLLIWLQNVIKTIFGLFSTQLKVLIEPAVQGGDCSFFMVAGTVIERMYQYIYMGITHKWLYWVVWSEVIMSVIRIPLVIMGLWYMVLEKKDGLAMLFVLCIMLFCMVTGMDGCCRYRIVCEPFLLMITAYALVVMYNKRMLAV